ncbi:MAG: T9SS type A sorting domain-containing protein [Bacteroidota bacterium]|nr:T9SS type A sorting domain-containing protein [Bacteroidota bacterium]
MKCILFPSLLLVTLTSMGQSPAWEPQWDKKYGGIDEDIISTFTVAPDSSIILGGTSFSGVSGDKSQPNHDTSLTTADFWVIRTDSSGTILWEKRYGGSQNENLSETIVTSDGGLLSGGQSFSGNSGDKTEANWDTTLNSNDYWIIKTDGSGNIQWDKRFGGTSFEIFGGVKQVADGGYIISGSSFSGADGDKSELNHGGWDYWIVRVNDLGNIIWNKRFGGLGDDFSTNVVVTQDGDYLLAGYSNSGIGGDKSETNRGDTDFWLVKVDDTGNKIWDKTFGGNNNDWLFAITATADGGFITGGQSFSEATGDKSEPNHDPTTSGSDRWIVKADANGAKQWDKTIGGLETDDLSRIIQTPDNGFLLSGDSYSDTGGDKSEDNLGPEQTWVVKTDSMGVIQWDKTILTYGHDELGSAIPWGDKCFIAVNFTQSDTGGYKTEIGWGYGDYWMIKMCDEAPLSTQEPEQQNNGWQSFPNPVTNQFTLISSQPVGIITVEIYDVSGRLIHRADYDENATGKNVEIDAKYFSRGMLVCRIIEARKVTTLRVIKTG